MREAPSREPADLSILASSDKNFGQKGLFENERIQSSRMSAMVDDQTQSQSLRFHA